MYFCGYYFKYSSISSTTVPRGQSFSSLNEFRWLSSVLFVLCICPELLLEFRSVCTRMENTACREHAGRICISHWNRHYGKGSRQLSLLHMLLSVLLLFSLATLLGSDVRSHPYGSGVVCEEKCPLPITLNEADLLLRFNDWGDWS